MDSTKEEQNRKFIGEKALYLVIIALLITLGGMGWFIRGSQQQLADKEKEIVFLNDTIRIERNAQGQSVSKIARLEANNARSFLAIKNLTGDNKRLQDVLSINKDRLGPSGSVSVITTNTSINTKVPTQIVGSDTTSIAIGTTSEKVDTVKVYPIYKADVNLGKWVKINVLAARDSTSVKALVVNEYDLVIGEDPIKGTGFLGIGRKYQAFSEVTNLNPYSETTTLKTFSIRDTRKKSKVGYIIIGALGFIGGILIAK